MSEWAYRATESRIGLAETRALLTAERFLCRSAFNVEHRFIAKIRDVLIGDVLHVYYKDVTGYVALGAWDIVDGDVKSFAGLVKQTSLQIVTNQGLHQKLTNLVGYDPDPLVQRFTGWPVEPSSAQNRPFPTALFDQYQGSLVKF